MLKFKKKLLCASLAAVVAISSAAVPVWSESTEGAAAEAETTAAAEEVVTETGVFVTEEQAFSSMKLMAENSKIALYVDEEKYTFAIENKENGYIWWSSFYNTDEGNGVQVSRRSTLLSIDVVGTESKAVETARAYDKNVEKSLQKIENGVKFTFRYKKFDITVPLEVVINSDGSFTATVPADEIVEGRPETDEQGNTGYQIVTVNVLENFGGTDRTTDGYMIVPDGSGAVINYNNGAPSGDNNTYEAKVYGRDLAIGLLSADPVIEDVTMPVIARINKGENEDNGLVIISTDGDAYGIVHAAVTGQNVTDLNDCWFEYTLRTTDKYYMGNSNEPLTVFEAYGIKTGDLSTTYYPISGEELDYIDVADTYRKYLTDTLGVEKKTKSDSAPFYLTLFGGTTKTQSVLGFPVEIETAATTYKEALEIIRLVEEKGVTDIKIIYEDFNTAGIVGDVACNFQYSNLLGGKKDYQELYSHIQEKGYEIFPSCDIMEFKKSGNGYSFTLNASKQITKAYATQTPFELAFGLPHLIRPAWTILSPYYFEDIFNKLSKTFKEEGATGISLNQAANTLYSDFSRFNKNNRNYFVREDTVEILQNGYQKLKDDGFTILAENPNQYMLKYVDYIKDVPLYSSNYDIFDYDIPFTEMVLHGLIPYTTKAINRSADAQELRLLALATGTPVHYEMMYEKPNKFADSDYDTLYYTYYLGWIDNAANEYKLFKDVISSVSDAKINDYNRINSKEIETTFDNGATIYVNLETEEVKVNGKTVDLGGYGLGVGE